MTNQFTVGQRWISDTESDLGLGTIIDEELRQITVLFLATGDTRIYSKESAPLTRVLFSVGDSIVSHQGWNLSIERIEDNAGILTYIGKREDTGDDAQLPESELSNFLQFRTPRDRLFAGLLDGQRWFSLRRQVFEHRHALAHSPVKGLLGARIALLPHQVYIAVEAVSRSHPRLLLADEVGLGKTIEAGLILHSMLVNQQVNRVLITVPSTLLHQWLVEMLRKFSLKFSIMDAERFTELQPMAPDENPFLLEQLVLCSTDTLLDDEEIADAAIAAGWDLLIVDEAHHLAWEPNAPSPAYTLVEELASATPSVLLLTATPEQLGQAGHFARLRLLDPARFGSLESYIKEEKSFSWVAEVAGALSQDEALSSEQVQQLEGMLDTPFTDSEKATLGSSSALSMSELGDGIINKLIDRHGTGRLLFRNTRNAIQGFPERTLNQHLIENDDPESLCEWLIGFLATNKPHKVLLICSELDTVKLLAELLRIEGIAATQFHEQMSIVERDRAAAYFSDPEDDCRILLCSEIGSEGRNFQFLHHLVTFELPFAPDLLEQRIGRLDRIGQTENIQIHVPYAEGSVDQLMMRWYHEGLNAFESICRTGSPVAREMATLLHKAVAHVEEHNALPEGIEELISNTRNLNETLSTQLDSGRDKLLELNSNRPLLIQEQLDALARAERDYRLQDFMLAVFDRFGVNVDEQTHSWILHPSDNMHVEQFPYLPASGLTITFDRETALRREDFTFLSWDHPMVSASMDLILNEGFGQADCRVVSVPELPQGLSFVEAVYVMSCPANNDLNVERYLQASLQSYYVGTDGKDYSEIAQEINFDAATQRFDRNKLKQVVQQHRDLIDRMINRSTDIATAVVPQYIEEAKEAIEQEFNDSRERLLALQRVNSSVRDDEITALETKKQALLEAVEAAHPRPVSVRMMFNT